MSGTIIREGDAAAMALDLSTSPGQAKTAEEERKSRTSSKKKSEDAGEADDESEEEEDDPDAPDEMPPPPPPGSRGPRQSVSAEAYGAFNQRKAYEAKVIKKDAETKLRIKDVLTECWMFKEYNETNLNIIVDA